LKIIEKHIVENKISGTVRASDYLFEIFSYFETRSSVKNAIKNQRIIIDGIVCQTGTHIKQGQLIELREEEIKIPKIYKFSLDVIYEDNFIAVINKPSGISVSGNYYRTVQNALPRNLKKSEESDALPFPLPVHRLDNQTSGLLLIAKTRIARINFGKQFEEKKILKRYNAVVIGKTPEEGIIDFSVDEKEALTRFETVKTEKSLRNGYLSLLELYPQTGRTHQIRIHCEKAGFPILGDKLYHGNLPVFKGKGLFLSATEVAFSHPDTNKRLNFKISYPQKFDTIIEREKGRYLRKNRG